MVMYEEAEHFSCVDCGDHVAADEDGLCVGCGGETTIEKCHDCPRSHAAVRRERDELRSTLLRLHAEQQDEVEMLRVEVARLRTVCLQASASLAGLDFANNPYRETQRLIEKLREAGCE